MILAEDLKDVERANSASVEDAKIFGIARP